MSAGRNIITLSQSWGTPNKYVKAVKEVLGGHIHLDPCSNEYSVGWLARCAHAYEEYNSEVLALVPIAANTAHWKKYVFTKARAICFLYDTRLRFLENGQDSGKGAPMACAMIYWGDNYDRFYEVFIEHGAVVDISNLIGEQIGADRQTLKLFTETRKNNYAQQLSVRWVRSTNNESRIFGIARNLR